MLCDNCSTEMTEVPSRNGKLWECPKCKLVIFHPRGKQCNALTVPKDVTKLLTGSVTGTSALSALLNYLLLTSTR